MDDYFRSEAIRQRLRVGPLSNYLDPFARRLAEFGYATDTGQRQLRTIAAMSRWMAHRGLKADDLSEATLELFLRRRRRHKHVPHIEPRAVGLFLEYLRQTGVAARPLPTRSGDIPEPVEQAFERYLVRERGPGATVA